MCGEGAECHASGTVPALSAHLIIPRCEHTSSRPKPFQSASVLPLRMHAAFTRRLQSQSTAASVTSLIRLPTPLPTSLSSITLSQGFVTHGRHVAVNSLVQCSLRRYFWSVTATRPRSERSDTPTVVGPRQDFPSLPSAPTYRITHYTL